MVGTLLNFGKKLHLYLAMVPPTQPTHTHLAINSFPPFQVNKGLSLEGMSSTILEVSTLISTSNLASAKLGDPTSIDGKILEMLKTDLKL